MKKASTRTENLWNVDYNIVEKFSEANKNKNVKGIFRESQLTQTDNKFKECQ